MIMYGFGLIAIITETKCGWQIRLSKRVSVEIAALVAQRVWQRRFLWYGLSGVSSFGSPSGEISAQIFLLSNSLVW